MAFLAGDMFTATRANRLQPKTYRAAATAVLTGPQTNADVPGASVTFTTETANAVYKVDAVIDLRLTGATTALGSGNIAVDGTVQSEFGILRDGGGSSLTSATVSQVYRGTLGAAGSHTIKLVGSPATNQHINIYSSITVTIFEVV